MISRIVRLVVIVMVVASCGGTAPEVSAGSDPELFDGRAIWIGQCASCHGASGGGGRGPALDEGRVLDRFPDVADQEALILNGRGAMPAYDGRLTAEQISAVTRYTREILTVAE